MHDALTRAFDEVVAPLFARDGGGAELSVADDGASAELRFTGRCRGCPGRALCAESVALPALRSASPELRAVRFR